MFLIKAPCTHISPVPLIPRGDDCLVGVIDGDARDELDVLDPFKVQRLDVVPALEVKPLSK
jgi:hypothetical protein